jgi:hypothetical protein
MKSTLISVCGLIALAVVQPAFATDKAKPGKETKRVAVAKHGARAKAKPAKVAKAAPPKPKPKPKQHPWVGHNVAISESERHVVRAYVVGRIQASKGGRFNGVPQGLAKKVAWFNTLPTGWEKSCVRGKVLPAEVHRHCQPLPYDVVVKLPPPPPGTVLLAVDGKLLRLGYPTYEILDTFDVYSNDSPIIRSGSGNQTFAHALPR